jgi:hypothetical protein
VSGVIVFTAILGDCDSLKPAPKGADRCVCFTDNPTAHPDAKGWELVWYPVPKSPRREAWHLRCVPHQRVVWIDASFTLLDLPRLLRDAGVAPVAAIRHHRRSSPYAEGAELVKVGQATSESIARQLADYRRAGFDPKHLSISCVIVRDRSDAAQRFNETWAAQIAQYPGDNTQVSLDYSAWANGMTIKALSGTRHENPYSTHDAKDHKRRRRPYELEVAH